MDASPIFILACGRSGTTLLRAMLTCHSRIAIPRASHFIVELHDEFGGRPFSDDQAAQKAREQLLEHERVLDFGIDLCAARTRMELLERPSVANYCRIVFEEYARAQNKPRWGDKTTTYGPHSALLADLFPDAKMIHLHRDGRDVVTSLKSVPFGSSTTLDAALHWKQTVEAIREAGSKLATDRYTEISYESILEDPTAALTSICGFLGEAFEPGMLDYTEKVDDLILPQDNPYQRKLREKPSKEMLHKWKRDMPEQDRAIVEHVAGDLLVDLGYETSGARLNAETRTRLFKASARRSASRLKRRLSSLPLPQKARLHKAIAFGSDYLNPTRLRSAWLRPHSNLDRETHLRQAYDWICRAHDAGGDDGVARGSRIGSGVFQASYPETTGYIIPTMIDAARRFNRDDYLERARRMGDWEIDIQMKSGAVMGGTAGQQAKPAVFNTGQVMFGWNELFRATKETKYLDAARRAADWLVEIQEADGNWLRGHSKHAAPGSTTYNARVAWALCETGQLGSNDQHVCGAKRFIDLAVSGQWENGWFADCCLTDPERPLLHTLAYTMRGIYETGVLLENDAYVAAARRTADALLDRLEKDGFLPGRFGSDWGGAVSWSCLTGSAQTSIVLSRMARRDRNPRYADGATRINEYLMRRHDVTASDETLRGGVYGSWPVSGEYCRFEVINWAVKFFIDALNEESDTRNDKVVSKTV